MQRAKELEIAKVKEEAAADAVRVRQDAIEAAELRSQDSIAVHKKAVEEAQAKARDAEQYASELSERLLSQREIMEKAREEAVNAQKAKAFDQR